MEAKPFYRYYQDEKDDKVSQKVFLKFLVIFFVVYFLLIIGSYLFYQKFSYITISGRSMQSTLNPNPVEVFDENGRQELQDGVYIEHTQDVDYGDIVVLHSSKTNKEKTIIKRVLAHEGDYVTIVKLKNKEGQQEFHVLRVKQELQTVEVLEEEYVHSYSQWTNISNGTWETVVDGISYEPSLYEVFKDYLFYQIKTFKVKQLGWKDVVFFQVPENCYFFLGDNRANSNDSRALGCLEYKTIEGKVVDIVRDGSDYKGNDFWWFNRVKGFFRVFWREILEFFGA